MTDLIDFEQRVARLEQKHFQCDTDVIVNEPMRRARLDVENRGLYSAVWRFVPAPYYSWPLSERAKCLGARSIHHLCKSLLMENKKAPEASMDPTFPRYVLVVIQYASTLDVGRLITAIRALRPVPIRLDESQFDFRLASEEDNARITGFEHNSVTPFGMLQKDNIPIVLASSIVPLRFFWMGGGHVYLKLGMSVTDFQRAMSPVVADISQPRADATMAGGDENEV